MVVKRAVAKQEKRAERFAPIPSDRWASSSSTNITKKRRMEHQHEVGEYEHEPHEHDEHWHDEFDVDGCERASDNSEDLSPTLRREINEIRRQETEEILRLSAMSRH
jgi:hypothetical protein